MTTPAEKPRNDVYVRVQNILRAGLRTEEITDDVALDWELLPDGTERLAGVEVLAARGVEVDGLDVVTGRAHGTSADTGQACEPAFTDSLGVSAIVRFRRDVLRYPAGTIGLVTRQARNGPNRYAVMIPGDPFEYSVAAKDLEVVQGVERWWHRDRAGTAPDSGQAPDRLAWIDTAAETAAVERQARYQETACARRPAEERPDA